MTTWLATRDNIKAAFQTQFTAAGAAASVGIAWEDEERPMADQHLLLSVISWRVLHDRIVLAEGPPITRTLSSLTEVGIQVRAESIFNDGGSHSLQIAEEARRGMFMGAFTDALTADIQIIQQVTTSGVKASFESGGYQVMATSFDWVARIELLHLDPTTYDPLTSADVSGQATDVDDTEITVIDQVISAP